MHTAQDEEVAPLWEHHRGAAAWGLVAEVAADAVRLDIGVMDGRHLLIGQNNGPAGLQSDGLEAELSGFLYDNAGDVRESGLCLDTPKNAKQP